MSLAVEISNFLKFSASFSERVIFFSSKKSILVNPSTSSEIDSPKVSFICCFENEVYSIKSCSKPVITV